MKELEAEFNHFLDEMEGNPRMWHSEEQKEWALDIARHFVNWQKEQMLKDAFNETVEDAGFRYPQVGPIGLDDDFVTENDLHTGDKVKVIIVKDK